jgi:hypothetical protein
MKLSEGSARALLVDRDHGVLGTVHAQRGVDVVPVVYVLDDDGFVGVPVDLVKPKSSTSLQRERNLAADPRATLLVEHWDRDDWSRLWWVRAELQWAGVDTDRAPALADELARRFAQYRDRPFARMLVFRVVRIAGWTASGG